MTNSRTITITEVQLRKEDGHTTARLVGTLTTPTGEYPFTDIHGQSDGLIVDDFDQHVIQTAISLLQQKCKVSGEALTLNCQISPPSPWRNK